MASIFDGDPNVTVPPLVNDGPHDATSLLFNGDGGGPAILYAGADNGKGMPVAMGNLVIATPLDLHFAVGIESSPGGTVRFGGSSTADDPAPAGAVLTVSSANAAEMVAQSIRFIRTPYAEFFLPFRPEYLDNYAPCRLLSSGVDIEVSAKSTATDANDGHLIIHPKRALGFSVCGAGHVTINPFPAVYSVAPIVIDQASVFRLNGEATVQTKAVMIDSHNLANAIEPSKGLKLHVYSSGSLPGTCAEAPQGTVAIRKVDGSPPQIAIAAQIATGSGSDATTWKWRALTHLG